MASLHQPTLIVDNTSRISLPPEFAEHLQVEDQERLYTASELVFAAWLTGFVSVLVTLGAAYCWLLVLS